MSGIISPAGELYIAALVCARWLKSSALSSALVLGRHCVILDVVVLLTHEQVSQVRLLGQHKEELRLALLIDLHLINRFL